jgi:hypothetical protein
VQEQANKMEQVQVPGQALVLDKMGQVQVQVQEQVQEQEQEQGKKALRSTHPPCKWKRRR